jgi:LmbE family N-acetylglucosaminyl deacetylase
MKYKNTDKLLIVAHADDELIWAGEKLIKEKEQWDILCVVTPDYQSPFRIPIFLNKVSEYLSANTEMLPFEDTGFHLPINGDLFTPITKKLNSKEWTQILTHGPKGEYGHAHHIQVHNLVIRVAQETNNIDKLWVFDPIKHDKIESLTEEKRKMFAATYDDETDLPEGHPIKWIHGWNTTQGWEENIRKFI